VPREALAPWSIQLRLPAVVATSTRKELQMNLLYVILIIVLVLALLGFVGRGRW
jgi:hypothetical protein